jgi:uncharacterized protein involved in cysteine biosynthesis
MLDILRQSLGQVASPAFRRVLAKSVLLALVLLVALWGLLYALYRWWLFGLLSDHAGIVPGGWAATLLNLSAGLGLFVLMIALTLPVLRFVAGNYLDEIAAIVAPPRSAAASSAMQGAEASTNLVASSRLAARSLVTNLVMLPLALVPVLGPGAIFLVNSRNVGRSYFVMVNAAEPDDRLKRMMTRHRWLIWGAGAVIVAISAVPVVNTLAPTLGSIVMIHLTQRLSGGDA